jgi:hypothetical protein
MDFPNLDGDSPRRVLERRELEPSVPGKRLLSGVQPMENLGELIEHVRVQDAR